MIDAALIAQCADPGVKVEMVQEFIETVGGADHLTVTVHAGERVVLVPKPNTQDEAMALVKQYAGTAVVRVGVTQYPAGLGVHDVSELSYDLFDSCENIRMGTTLFGKVYRIVSQRFDGEGQAFENAVRAYRTGRFEGQKVFYEPDPAGAEPATPGPEPIANSGDAQEVQVAVEASAPQEPPIWNGDPNAAGIRIDLSRINGGDDI